MGSLARCHAQVTLNLSTYHPGDEDTHEKDVLPATWCLFEELQAGEGPYSDLSAVRACANIIRYCAIFI